MLPLCAFFYHNLHTASTFCVPCWFEEVFDDTTDGIHSSVIFIQGLKTSAPKPYFFAECITSDQHKEPFTAGRGAKDKRGQNGYKE